MNLKPGKIEGPRKGNPEDTGGGGGGFPGGGKGGS